MDFEHFLVGLSHFNSPGRKEEKMKTAFRLHDADDDGLIKFEDMMVYVKAITLEAMDGISYFLSFVYSTSLVIILSTSPFIFLSCCHSSYNL